jgi:hypothetical protein
MILTAPKISTARMIHGAADGNAQKENLAPLIPHTEIPAHHGAGPENALTNLRDAMKTIHAPKDTNAYLDAHVPHVTANVLKMLNATALHVLRANARANAC